MPKFTLLCSDCQDIFDKRTHTSQIPPSLQCPSCGSSKLSKTFPSSLQKEEEIIREVGDLVKAKIRELKNKLEDAKHDGTFVYHDDVN